MNYLLLNHIKVQNANAIAGFTWGFPAVTHFLGFSHNLQRKLSQNNKLTGISLGGCGVISHDQETHTFGKFDKSFTQHRYQPYLHDSNKKSSSPPIIEEGKMNMKISLLIEVNGNVGNLTNDFTNFIQRCCFTQKLAGGTILEICEIAVQSDPKLIKRKLLPGFALMDRSDYLDNHLQSLRENDPEAEQIKAWLDFSALKQAARPNHELISSHLSKQTEALQQLWESHLQLKPYSSASIPAKIKEHFSSLVNDKVNKKLLTQWQHYVEPTEKTPAGWEYLPKPFSGFLVPIMTGYKAISQVYENNEVGNTRDSETPVCFVESAHSVGEWLAPHRITDLEDTLWHYHHEEHWYLCKQNRSTEEDLTEEAPDL